MANPIINDVFKEQIPDGKSKRKKGKVLLLIIILLIVVIASVVVFFYLKRRVVESKKTEFLEYLRNGNIVSILEFDSFNELNERIKDENSKIDSKISVSYNSVDDENEEGEFELDDVELDISSLVDVKNKKEYMDVILNYASNDLFELDFLKSKDSIAIKSDEIVNKYVGSKIENLPEQFEKIIGLIYPDFGDSMYGVIFNKLENINNDNFDINFNFSNKYLDKYIEVINTYVEETSFSSETATLKEKNIEVVKYNMSIPESKMKEVSVQLLKTLKEDDDIINMLMPILEKVKLKREDIQDYVDELIEYVEDIEVNDNNMYTLSLCVYNDRIERIILTLSNYATVDVEYNYDEKENSVKLTILENEENEGFSVTIKSIKSEISETLQLIINIIEENETVAEASIKAELVNNNQDNYDFNTIIKISYLDYVGELDISNNISFEDVEVPDLTDDICLFIDKLDEEEFKNDILAIQEKTKEVINKKMKKLSLINNNTQSILIEQPNITENQELKNEAKQKLINAVSSAMREAESQNGRFELSDVESIIIPNSEYSISVSENLAIIIVDGFEFKLDSDFNLTD